MIRACNAAAVLTPEEMASADRQTIAAGTAGFRLMELAGTAVADVCTARFGHGTRAVVVCGPGNNGGDGFIAAQKLVARGLVTKLVLLGERSGLKGDAAEAAARWRGEIFKPDRALFQNIDLVVDAIYGAGLARDVTGEGAELIAWINDAAANGAQVVAVDLPSGIDGATGAVRGVAVRASVSVTFFRKKPGHLLLPGKAHAGRVEVADIGIRPAVLDSIAPKTFENTPVLWRDALPDLSPFDHKYTRGSVLVYSGGLTASGAARLAAAAALRIGAGLVSVAAPVEALAVIAAYHAAFIVRPRETETDWTALLSDKRLRACIIGPGAGVTAATRRAMLEALAMPDLAVVLDADAITLLAKDPDEAFALIRTRRAPVVFTPHEGEFRRLFGGLAQASKLDRARGAADMSGAIIVYKGADSVMAAPGGSAVIESRAPAFLATAGSGDVLAGTAGGLLAQGMDGLSAACASVHLHGLAGTMAGRGLIADDLPQLLPKALLQVTGN